MKSRFHYFLTALFLCITTANYAQLGIRAGVNMANEIKSFDLQAAPSAFETQNLTGHHIGLVYQAMSPKSGMGCEFGALLSQKGCSFSDTASTAGIIKEGYHEMNYLEIPVNFRYRITVGAVGLYGTAGIYGGYALSAETVDEVSNDTRHETFGDTADHLDYGYQLGTGLEIFRKIQLGASWSHGLKNTANANANLPSLVSSKNKLFSVNLVYVF